MLYKLVIKIYVDKPFIYTILGPQYFLKDLKINHYVEKSLMVIYCIQKVNRENHFDKNVSKKIKKCCSFR